VASATSFNSEINDIGSALSDSINKAGTKAFAANQPMGGFILTGLGAGTSSGHSVRYEQMNSAISAYAQPLDATLTALAALSWASGNPLVQFTAADTVSLTLTPSVSSVTASQGAANTTPSGTFKNTTDNALVIALQVGGARATPTASDVASIAYYLNNSASAQKEFGRISVVGTTLTAGAEVGRLKFSVSAAGAIADRMTLSTGALFPSSDGLLDLGLAGTAYGTLYLKSTGVLNFGNGNATLTHSSGLLTSNVPIQAGMALSTETGGTLTSASANKYIDLASGPTMPNAVFSAGQWQYMLAGASSRTITRGASVTMYVNGVDSATATLAARGTCFAFWDTASVCYLSGDVS